MKVERYSHVMHITSQRDRPARPTARRLRRPARLPPRRHRLAAPQGPGHADHRRARTAPPRPYAGAVGYVDFTGNMDTCIALRTMVVQASNGLRPGRRRHRRRQRPGSEYQETLNKARGLLKAIEITEQRSSSA